jgi:predicted DCC family thiol-disulfide oxidoreductase YuxK
MIRNWAEQEHFLNAAKVFRLALLFWFILHTLLLLPFHETIWGPNAFALRMDFDGSWYAWIFQLSLHPSVARHYLWFIAGQLLFATLGMLGLWPRLMLALTYILTMNINSLTGVVLDGGNNLSQLLLLYLIFVNSSGRPLREGWHAPWLRALSNSGFLLCQLQVAIVYLTAGLLKSNGHLWQNGMALYYLFQSETYGHPWVGMLMQKSPILSLIGTYTTLGFQWLFPILIWQRRWRLPLISFGLLLHLGIAFGMGLFTFGLVMCVSYLLFLPEDKAEQLLATFRERSPLIVGYDEHCQICQQVARIIQKLDWFGLIEKDGAHEPASPALAAVPLTQRLNAIQAVTANERFEGFAALFAIARRIPLGQVLLPLFWSLSVTGIGPRIYQRIAAASWRQTCKDGVCTR